MILWEDSFRQHHPYLLPENEAIWKDCEELPPGISILGIQHRGNVQHAWVQVVNTEAIHSKGLALWLPI